LTAEVTISRVAVLPAVRSLRFDALAGVYDRTRTVDARSLSLALDDVVTRYPPKRFSNLLDAGAGTGRIALPLAKRGYRVLGADISRSMLARFRQNEGDLSPAARTDLMLADVARLPLKDQAVGLSLATHLFYFVARWRDAALELLRVTDKRGAVLLLHTGTGREVPEIRDRYREICGELGFLPRSVGVEGVGVESTKEVLEFYKTEGCRVTPRAGIWKWVESVSPSDALDDLAAKSYSFTLAVPNSIHTAAMLRLREEVTASHPSPSLTYRIENAISLSIVSRE
jgi:ubiquinone/menaquinone biosynthesis C-methylase UbiE